MKIELDRIAEVWGESGSLSGPEISRLVGEVRSHSRITNSVDRLSEAVRKLGLGEVMGDNNQRAAAICTSGDWAISVILDYIVDGEITLAPFPMILAPVNGAQIEIDVYQRPIEDFENSFTRNLSLGQPLERKCIVDGEFWATPAKGVVAEIASIVGAEDGRKPAIMSINGGAYAPYVRVFDEGGNMAPSALASTGLNSQQFFADFLKNVVASDFLEHLSEKEKRDLFEYLDDQLSDPSDVISEALWPMLQSAAVLDRSLGLQALENVANSSHELASHAAAVLADNLTKTRV